MWRLVGLLRVWAYNLGWCPKAFRVMRGLRPSSDVGQIPVGSWYFTFPGLVPLFVVPCSDQATRDQRARFVNFTWSIWSSPNQSKKGLDLKLPPGAGDGEPDGRRGLLPQCGVVVGVKMWEL